VRLWTLHPQYLDRLGLVAVWREGLLAQAVLAGETRGYRHHPQLERFRAQPVPARAIGRYLAEVAKEAKARGYSFDASKIRVVGACEALACTTGQVAHEWHHLVAKLADRDPRRLTRFSMVRTPDVNPVFVVRPGPIEPWEVVPSSV